MEIFGKRIEKKVKRGREEFEDWGDERISPRFLLEGCGLRWDLCKHGRHCSSLYPLLACVKVFESKDMLVWNMSMNLTQEDKAWFASSKSHDSG